MEKSKIFLLLSGLFVFTLGFFLFKNKSPVHRQGEKETYFTEAGIIPHHLLADELTLEFLSRLSVQNPQTIILVGPNHQEKSGGKPLTSLADWQTPSGLIKADKRLIDGFLSLNLVEINEEVLLNEHSISDPLSLIKSSLPEVSVFPIILSAKMSFEEIETLAGELSEKINEETVLIASVDFSHGLKSEDARQNDQQTLEMIKNFDYPRLLSLGSDFIDSPQSLALLLLVVQKTNKANIEVLGHANSGELMNNDFAETTSYFTIRYH